MASLQSLLNPEETRRKTTKLALNMPGSESFSLEGSPSTPEMTSASENDESISPTIMQDYSHNPNHGHHLCCPDSLTCLPDTNDRPQHTLPVILRCAILGSPNGRLTIRDIYAAMETKYPYYATAGQTWKQSVRHHLSLNNLFERRERPATDPGFGSYWTVNLTAPPGTKRPRKRGRKPAKPRTHRSSNAADGHPRIVVQRYESDADEPPDTTLHPVLPEPDPNAMDCTPLLEPGPPTHSYPYVWPPQSNRTEDEIRLDRVPSLRPVMSPELPDSDEDRPPIHPMNRRSSLPPGLNAFYAPKSVVDLPFKLPPMRPFSETPEGFTLLEQMEAEMVALRRQSANALALSVKLNKQLALSHEETNQMRVTIQEFEGLLDEERRRRRRAENALNEALAAERR